MGRTAREGRWGWGWGSEFKFKGCSSEGPLHANEALRLGRLGELLERMRQTYERLCKRKGDRDTWTGASVLKRGHFVDLKIDNRWNGM